MLGCIGRQSVVFLASISISSTKVVSFLLFSVSDIARADGTCFLLPFLFLKSGVNSAFPFALHSTIWFGEFWEMHHLWLGFNDRTHRVLFLVRRDCRLL